MKKVILVGIAAILLLGLVVVTRGCQSRMVSRFTGLAVEIKLPADVRSPCLDRAGEIVGVSFDRNGRKNLVYFNKEGYLMVQEYKDWKMFEGKMKFVK